MRLISHAGRWSGDIFSCSFFASEGRGGEKRFDGAGRVVALDLLFLSRSSRLSASQVRRDRRNSSFRSVISHSSSPRTSCSPLPLSSLSDLDASHPDDMVKVLLGVLMLLNGLGGALAALRGGASLS